MSLLYTLLGALLAALLGVASIMEISEDPLLVETGVALPVDIKQAFQYLAEMNNFPKWYPNIIDFYAVDTRPMGIGKHFLEIANVPLVGEVNYDNVVIGYESPRFISFISDMWVLPRIDLVLTHRDSARFPTLLTWKMYSRRRSFLFRYTICPLLQLIFNNHAQQAMLNLNSNIHKAHGSRF